MASADEGEEDPAGSALPGEEQRREMPDSMTIGTKRAYDYKYAFSYKRQTINNETFYVGPTALS